MSRRARMAGSVRLCSIGPNSILNRAVLFPEESDPLHSAVALYRFQIKDDGIIIGQIRFESLRSGPRSAAVQKKQPRSVCPRSAPNAPLARSYYRWDLPLHSSGPIPDYRVLS